MSNLAIQSAYVQLEDRLDEVGQRYRVQRLVRGGMLWIAGAIVATLVACLAAHLLRQGTAAAIVLAVWVGWMLLSGGVWVLRPMLMRPTALEVARLVESRLTGLHNELTNGVLLARAEDLHDNPLLPRVLDEILRSARGAPLAKAVTLNDLRPLGKRLAYIVVPLLVIFGIFPRPFAHGWQQMFRPATFVPQVGRMQILDVQPQDATLVYGQPLEITVVATGPGTPQATLFFEHQGPGFGDRGPGQNQTHVLSPTPDPRSPTPTLRYAYRVERVEAPLRFRVEVGATQSAWYAVKVVRQVKLTELALRVLPPPYTRQAASVISLKADEIATTPLSVPQGSQIELTAAVDVSVSGAMLQTGDSAPVGMQAERTGQRFVGSFTIVQDTPVAILLTQGAGQIIARLPESTLLVRCTIDVPPTIEMKWPMQDVTVAPQAEIKLQAMLKDDHGIASGGALMATSPDAPLAVAWTQKYSDRPEVEMSALLDVPAEMRKHGQSVRVQLSATDNRDLSSVMKAGGPQSSTSPIFEIKFRDPEQIASEQKQQADALRAMLMEMLKQQQELHARVIAWMTAADADVMKQIGAGQADLRLKMQTTAQTFGFDETNKIVQKTLLVLAYNPAKDAVDLAAAIGLEPLDREKMRLSADLQSRQRKIISTLESLLALLNASPEPTTQPAAKKGGDLPNQQEELKKLNEALKEFIAQEQRILDQTAALAKKPVDDFDERDKQLLEDLTMAQEKLDAFMQSKINDFSKLAEQDMANASLLKELLEVYSEVTMAKDALKKQAMEIAVAAEDMGVELAKEINSNLEKWLLEAPDREKWTQEDPLAKTDIPMAELPLELEDMIGELMEEQEDLFDEMEDMDANWFDSMDKGAGWGAADGPIANMSAKGVTGNQLPNNNNMSGRSGEGRSGKSQGEFVEETASGKGGRNTPTRLDPTPFQQGQVKDESKDPVGGATGGGKISGQGGEGLEGPVPPALKEQMQRLAQKQAQLRNNAERLNLQYQLGRYDSFKMLESIALMRRVESDLNANRYQNALRRKDVLIDAMETSNLLLSGRVHVQHDSSPTISSKLEDEIHDAMQGQLPAAWSEALKEYYRKLAQE